MLGSAPLVDTPAAPIPEGAEAEWFSGAGGVKLRAAIFNPEGRARGSIVLSGGRTEPIEKYFETIEDFRSRGFVVLAHDWRGQGLSHRELGDRLKGHANGYKAFLDDYRALLAAYDDRLPKPWLAVGHSMGGCLTLLALAHGEDRFTAAILSAPMLGINTGKVSPRAARLMARMHTILGRARRYTLGQPGKPFDDDFETNALTHDRERFARNCALLKAEPDLALGAPTWGWLDFAFRATAFLARPERLRAITIPVTIVQADEDKLVDNAAQAAAARCLPQGRLISAPGAYHEILMETDPMRNIFLRAFDALTGRVAPKPAAAPKPAVHAPTPAAPAPSPAVSGSSAAASSASASTQAAAPAPSSNGAKPMATATAKKPAAKKPAAKPAAAKKPAVAKKPAAKKPAAKKPAAKPAAAKKPAVAKKPAAKPAAAKKPAVAKKPAAKKPAAKKPAAKKPAAKKPAAKAAAAKKPAAVKKPAAKKAPAKKPVAKAAAAKKAPSVKKPAAKKTVAKKKK